MKKFDLGDLLVAFFIGIGTIVVCFLLLLLIYLIYAVFGAIGSIFLLIIGAMSGAYAYKSLK